MIARSDWRQPVQGGKTWIADLGALHLCVRSGAASSRGEFAGYVDGQCVGFWDSLEVAKTQVAKLAVLPLPNTTRWTAHRKAEIVAAVRSGLISLNEAYRRYNLTSEEFASWQRRFETHGVAGLRATREPGVHGQ